MELTLLFICFVIPGSICLCFSGHGGASGYLSLMALFTITRDVMKPAALLPNLFVPLISFVRFYSTNGKRIHEPW